MDIYPVETLINPYNYEQIQQLHFYEIAFPEIDYGLNVPLSLTATTLHVAFTSISNRVDQIFLAGLEWNFIGDV